MLLLPLQEAVVTALNFDDSYYDELLNIYTDRKNLFINGLKNMALTTQTHRVLQIVMVNVGKYWRYMNDIKF